MTQEIGKMLKWIGLLIGCVPVIFFAVCAYRYFAVSGRYEMVWTPTSAASKNLIPVGRVSKPLQDAATADTFQRMIADPVYLNLNVPRTFEDVEVTVDMRNTGQPLVELGLAKAGEWVFEFHPLDVPILESLNWSHLEGDDGTVLLQREKRFDSIEDFINHLPVEAGIATYHTSLDPDFIFSAYQPRPAVSTDVALRGAHTFKTYVENQPVDFSIDYIDLNRGFDEDSVSLQVGQQNTILESVIFPDDGNVVADNVATGVHRANISVADVRSGVFDISLVTTPDIIITRVSTSAGYLVTNQLFLAGSAEYANPIQLMNTSSTNLFTNATSVQGITAHPDGLQTILVDHIQLRIEHVNGPATVRIFGGEQGEIMVPQNDVTLTAQGWMSFSPESFFDPDYAIETLTPYTDMDGIDFVYASDLPKHSVTESTRTVRFSLDEVEGDKKSLRFIFSAPTLDQRKAELNISSIHFTFSRPPLTPKSLWNKLKQHI